MKRESNRVFSFSITSADSEQRVDSFLAAQIEDLTRSRIQELIRTKCVRINGTYPKASYRLKPGDLISLSVPPALPPHLEPEVVEFNVIHEDAMLVVVNKPAGLVVHPAPGHATGTLVHGLLQRCPDLSGIGGILRPGIGTRGSCRILSAFRFPDGSPKRADHPGNQLVLLVLF